MRIVVAGAPPPTRTIARVETELGWQFNQIYGLTETSPLLTVNRPRAEWDDLDRRRSGPGGSAGPGTPAIGTRLRIGESGEVLARSNTVLAGYWQQPEETAASLADEGVAGPEFHTGDGGMLDDDGYLTISDRKKDIIITGGENVSSIEVEDAVFSHPSVAEVAVIGVPAREVGRDDQGAGRRRARRRGDRGRRSSPGARSGSPATRRRPRWTSSSRSRGPPPGRCRSSGSGRRTGRAASGRSTSRYADGAIPMARHPQVTSKERYHADLLTTSGREQRPKPTPREAAGNRRVRAAGRVPPAE